MAIVESEKSRFTHHNIALMNEVTYSAWPLAKVDVPQETVRRIYQLLPPDRNLGTNRTSMLDQIPDDLAIRVARSMGVEGITRTHQCGAANSLWELLLFQQKTNEYPAYLVSLYRLFLLDILCINFINKALTAGEIIALAEHGQTASQCRTLLGRFGLLVVAKAMTQQEGFEAWQCDWLAWQALGAHVVGPDAIPNVPVPVVVNDLKRQMPLHASAIEGAYKKWLERKDWQLGERMSSTPELGAPAFERPNVFMSSWLLTVNLATGIQFSTRSTLESVLEQLSNSGHHSLKEQLFVGLCDDQMYRILQKSGSGFQHTPKWLDGAGSGWGWKLGLNLERLGEWSEASTGYWWGPKGDLESVAIKFVRSLLLKFAGNRPLAWFYERPVESDGFMEVSPGWPSTPYLQGKRQHIEVLRDDNRCLIVWGKEFARGPIIDSPIPCFEFAIEVWNKELQRVDAKVFGTLYGLDKCSRDPQQNMSLLLSASYSLSQDRLLFFVDAIRQNEDIHSWVAAGPVAVIEGWERHAESQAGIGASTLEMAFQMLLKKSIDVTCILLKVDPLQFSALAGGEPAEIQEARSEARKKLINYTTNAALVPCGSDVQLLFVDQTLNGDLKDVIRDTDLPESQRAVLNNALFQRRLVSN